MDNDFVFIYSRQASRDRRIAMVERTEPQPTWVFLSNHAHVLLCIARDPDTRTRDIAERVGITERAARRIVSDLISEGYPTRTKIGRRKHYAIHRNGHPRPPAPRPPTTSPP